jgi:hypothetical protein
LREVMIGVAARVLLYGIFWAGDALAAAVFGFAPRQVEAIYAIRELGHPWMVGAVLLLVTSPGEEFFGAGMCSARPFCAGAADRALRLPLFYMGRCISRQAMSCW